MVIKMENRHTPTNYLASLSWPHSVVCILCAQQPLRMQARETRKNKTASLGNIKVALPLNDEFNL